MEKQKQCDSIIVGAIVWSFCGIGIGVFDLITKRHSAFIWLALGGLSLIYLIYLLRKTRNNTNERCEDERKAFISQKSQGISFTILYSLIIILEFFIGTGKIKMNSDSVLITLMISGLIIQFLSYLFYKFKY
ncbi:DUF2178 domain-containing protein [Clostridium estertheticum]|uniref:DUF2178 domain-containing protein n=1 Tax=Clostridium estertheticum TaxID=238834 RepID=A0A7Y3SWH9_9CLOT|nr:DUF2178 domain-containing protein [Clostridium estertheticum]MBW9173303.1 DUF2178 domain-containing protein [Clostridium estertheticum]NNU76626.1 DUF2178 domain-containing protein [Clostridium estertheticum]WBL45367.1 DUF2178 domain-containing protein [Clostridium estertheticum]WLC73448.1 DUF2178 domain-containing protein [Clostridium estertheticum]